MMDSINICNGIYLLQIKSVRFQVKRKMKRMFVLSIYPESLYERLKSKRNCFNKTQNNHEEVY